MNGSLPLAAIKLTADVEAAGDEIIDIKFDLLHDGTPGIVLVYRDHDDEPAAKYEVKFKIVNGERETVSRRKLT